MLCKLRSCWQGKGMCHVQTPIVLLMNQNVHFVHNRRTWHFLWQIYLLDHGTDQQRWAGDQRGSGWVSQHDSVQKGKAAAIFSLHVCVSVSLRVCNSLASVTSRWAVQWKLLILMARHRYGWFFPVKHQLLLLTCWRMDFFNCLTLTKREANITSLHCY